MALALDPRYVMELQSRRRPAATAATFRRRRLAVALVAVLVVLLAMWALRAVAAAPERTAVRPAVGAPVLEAPTAPTVYVVHPGDTLWSIAERFGPAGATRSYVDDLVAANGSPSIEAGQQLVLP